MSTSYGAGSASVSTTRSTGTSRTQREKKKKQGDFILDGRTLRDIRAEKEEQSRKRRLARLVQCGTCGDYIRDARQQGIQLCARCQRDPFKPDPAKLEGDIRDANGRLKRLDRNTIRSAMSAAGLMSSTMSESAAAASRIDVRSWRHSPQRTTSTAMASAASPRRGASTHASLGASPDVSAESWKEGNGESQPTGGSHFTHTHVTSLGDEHDAISALTASQSATNAGQLSATTPTNVLISTADGDEDSSASPVMAGREKVSSFYERFLVTGPRRGDGCWDSNPLFHGVTKLHGYMSTAQFNSQMKQWYGPAGPPPFEKSVQRFL